MLALLFVLFAGMAIGCAILDGGAAQSALQRHLADRRVHFACLLCGVTLQNPFIAAVQVIVYAGAIMVLFVFVIMLLNVIVAGNDSRDACDRLS